MPELSLYRHIVDVLLAEHEASDPPGINDGYPIHQLSCVWGIYAQIHRFGRAAVMLSDNGMGHEANILVRAMLEYTVLLHWAIDRGDDGVDAVLANQSKQMRNWVKNTKGTSFVIPPDIAAELGSDQPGIDESKAVRTFKEMCGQIDVQDLYTVYGIYSLFVHPTFTTSNIYCDTSDNEAGLRLRPSGDSRSSISLIAHCLIWAGRAFDRLTPGHPREDDLENLARQIKARPILPAYHPIE